ncbi:hypothetical protein PtA15_4A203 [Puccinia triticina]|nr:uncharacterized protein PtA15_4A203 [Puccinia triticina]WAQ83755.1 hypothetical protein PtA15_4A203 [Puccinia triticina]
MNPQSDQTTIGLVIQQLESLSTRYQPIIVDYDVSMEFNQPELTIFEIYALSNQLNDIQTRVLPSFRQQLCDLLASLGVTDSEKSNSAPNLLDTLEILSRLSPILDEISTFVHSIARIAHDSPEMEENDGHLEDLKQFKAKHLVSHIDQLLQDHARYLFISSIKFLILSEFVRFGWEDGQRLDCCKERMIEALAESIEFINTTILSSKRSDFNFLQDHCQECVENLTECIDKLCSARTESSSQSISLRSLTAELVNSVLSIVKLIRIFFNKFARNPTNKPPFTIDPSINSDEFDRLEFRITELRFSLEDFTFDLIWMYERHDRRGDLPRDLTHYKQLSQVICDEFHRTFSWLKIYHVGLAVHTLIDAVCMAEATIQALSN